MAAAYLDSEAPPWADVERTRPMIAVDRSTADVGSNPGSERPWRNAAIVATLIIGVRGAMVPIGALVLMEADGVTARNAGMANGLWFAIGEVGGVTGPFSAGLIADTSLGFEGVVIVLAAVAALTAGLAVSTRVSARPRLR